MDILRKPDITRALGWEQGTGAEIYTGYIEDRVLLLPFRPVQNRERSGFIMLMRPTTEERTWSVNIVVPERTQRNGFTALAALDAMCHLIFDVRKDKELVWRIEPSNGASRVLPRRLGYPKREDVTIEGTLYEQYGIGREAWEARQSRIARSGTPFAFEVEPVPSEEIAHNRIIAAIRSRPAPAASWWQRLFGPSTST